MIPERVRPTDSATTMAATDAAGILLYAPRRVVQPRYSVQRRRTRASEAPGTAIGARTTSGRKHGSAGTRQYLALSGQCAWYQLLTHGSTKKRGGTRRTGGGGNNIEERERDRPRTVRHSLLVPIVELHVAPRRFVIEQWTTISGGIKRSQRWTE